MNEYRQGGALCFCCLLLQSDFQSEAFDLRQQDIDMIGNMQNAVALIAPFAQAW